MNSEKFSGRTLAGFVAGGCALAVAVAAGIHFHGKPSAEAPETVVARTDEDGSPKRPDPLFLKNPDGRPDALVLTERLSELPRDILQQKALGEILSRDFVFYYEESESYLSLKGSLKRIAFEHELTLFDRLLETALSSPAEVALWKSYDGRLEDFVLSVDSSLFTEALVAAAKISASDQQLSILEERKEDGEKFTVYRLKYAATRELYFASIGDRLVFFSHPKIPLPTKSRMAKWSFPKFEGAKGEASGYFRFFEAGRPKAKHSLYLTASFLSFGYQRFFASVDALRFRFGENDGWSAQALFAGEVRPAAFDASAIWKATPKSPSFCAALPVDAKAVGGFAENLFSAEIGKVAGSLSAPVAICWYAESKLYTPLVIAKFAAEPNADAVKTAFERMVGNLESGILSADGWARFRDEQTRRANGEKIDDPIRATQFEPPHPVVATKKSGATVWSREVSSRYGIYDAEKSANAKKMRSKRYFNVRLALAKDYVLFSGDDRLVDSGLSVLEKKYPALSDSLGNAAQSGFVIYPAKLSELLKQSALESLPAEQESVFRENVSRRLLPALERMEKVSAMTVDWPAASEMKSDRWEELKWKNLSSR